MFYGYCITRKDGEKTRYLTGLFSVEKNNLNYSFTENKNLAYLYETTEKAESIARYFPGSTVDQTGVKKPW